MPYTKVKQVMEPLKSIHLPAVVHLQGTIPKPIIFTAYHSHLLGSSTGYYSDNKGNDTFTHGIEIRIHTDWAHSTQYDQSTLNQVSP